MGPGRWASEPTGRSVRGRRAYVGEEKRRKVGGERGRGGRERTVNSPNGAFLGGAVPLFARQKKQCTTYA